MPVLTFEDVVGRLRNASTDEVIKWSEQAQAMGDDFLAKTLVNIANHKEQQLRPFPPNKIEE